jgi:hypothetical protein
VLKLDVWLGHWYASGSGEPVGNTVLGDGGKMAADAAPRILLTACRGDRDVDSHYLGTFAPLELTPISVER